MLKYVIAIAIALVILISIVACIFIFFPDAIDAIRTGYETEPWVYRADQNYDEDSKISGSWGHVLELVHEDGTITYITRETTNTKLTLIGEGNSVVQINYKLFSKLRDSRYETVSLDLIGMNLQIFVVAEVDGIPIVITDMETSTGSTIELLRDHYIPVYTASATVSTIMGGYDEVTVIMLPSSGDPLLNDKRLDSPVGYMFEITKDSQGNTFISIDTDGDVYKLITENPFEG